MGVADPVTPVGAGTDAVAVDADRWKRRAMVGGRQPINLPGARPLLVGLTVAAGVAHSWGMGSSIEIY